jgi:hypothetical protein
MVRNLYDDLPYLELTEFGFQRSPLFGASEAM